MSELLGVTGGAAFAAAFIINAGLKATPVINNKWLPLFGLMVGLAVGILFSIVDMGNWQANVVMGLLAGGNSTTFNELYNHLFGGNDNGKV